MYTVSHTILMELKNKKRWVARRKQHALGGLRRTQSRSKQGIIKIVPTQSMLQIACYTANEKKRNRRLLQQQIWLVQTQTGRHEALTTCPVTQ